MVREETMKLVVAKIREVPDMTLLGLIETFQLPISESVLCKRLIKLGLTYHKVKHVLQALIDKWINVVFLPPYSPDVNPTALA